MWNQELQTSHLQKKIEEKKLFFSLSLLVTLLVLPSWIPFEWAQFVLHPTSGGCFAFWFPSFMEFHSLVNNIPVLSFWVCSQEKWNIQLLAIWLGVMEGLLYSIWGYLVGLSIVWAQELGEAHGEQAFPGILKHSPGFFCSNDERFACD